MNNPIQPNISGTPATNNLRNVGQSVSGALSNLKDSVNNAVNSFSTDTNASSGFLSSNSIIAKFAFLILVIILFMFLLNLGIMLIGYFTSPSDNPYIVKGMIDAGSSPLIIPQNPNKKDAVQILKSNNQSTGMEFTWSVWLLINDIANNPIDGKMPDKYQHIFSKGNDPKNTNVNGISSVNNAPGLYLTPAKNELHLIMNTVSPDNVNEVIDISNIPIKKWVNVVIRLENTILDVYINGTISSRLILQNVPKQNYNDVYVCQNGGFSGKLADLRYFNKALNVFEINSIVSNGPDTTVSKLAYEQGMKGNYSYLSNLWYASKL